MSTIDPKQLTFLIVDDIDNMRRSIRAMLKLIAFGKSYCEACNGKEAWAILNNKETTVDFIISDWNMPKMNGTELLSLIRSSKKLRDIPFLMITAETNQSIVAEAAENDVDAYLTKPFVTATLELKIKELLNQASNPSPLAQLLKRAEEFSEKGMLDEAIECISLAVKSNPRSSKPLRELGRLYLKKGFTDKALLCFQRASDQNRLDIPSLQYLGQIYLKMGDSEKAITYFTKALDLSPRNADRAFRVASLLLDRQKLPEAEKIFRSMLRNSPEDIDLATEIADTSLKHDLYEFASKTYRSVLNAAPDRQFLNKKLGHALVMAGHPREAIEILEKVAPKFPNDADLLINLAQAYFDINLKIRADQLAIRVQRLDPQNARAQAIIEKCL
ncbi:MAG: response regulator [Proteobacteria bacterium]|nr:response regulator [Desulfobulbaceae bacterium]MBU4151946.1 response regulator [Pseudomonadota bacterium]